MRCVVILLALVYTGILIDSSRRSFPTLVELGHLPAAVSHCEHSRFDLDRVNPPLTRSISVSLGGYENNFDWTLYTDAVGERPEIAIGSEFLKCNRLSTIDHFMGPRLVALCFWGLGLVLIYVIVHDAAGVTAGCYASVLWITSPNLLANAYTILPDVGAVVFGMLSCLAVWKYLFRANFSSAFMAGVATGIALLTKLTWLTALLTLPGVAAICIWKYSDTLPKISLHLRGLHFVTFWVASLFTLNAGYGFEGSFTTLADYEFCSETLGGEGCNSLVHGNRFKNSWLGMIPVPFPRNYILGIDYLKMEVEQKMWSFLFGEWKFGSWPYYYAMTTLMKTPEPTLIAAVLGLVVFLLSIRRGLASPELVTLVMLLAVPALVCFTLISLQGGFNHHHRYVLMIYPPIFMFASLLTSPLTLQIFGHRIENNEPTVVVTSSESSHYEFEDSK